MEIDKKGRNTTGEHAKESGFDWLAHNVVNPACNSIVVQTVNGGIELAALAANNKELCKHKLEPRQTDIATPGSAEFWVQSGTELVSSLLLYATAGRLAHGLMRPAGVLIEEGAALPTIKRCLKSGKSARLPAEIGSLANRLFTEGEVPAQIVAGAAIDGIRETQTSKIDLNTLGASHLGNVVGGAVGWGVYEFGNFNARQFQLAKRCGVTSNYGLVPKIVNEIGRVGVRALTGTGANGVNTAISEKIGQNTVSMDNCLEAAGYGAVFNAALPYAQRALKHVPITRDNARLEDRSCQRLSVFTMLQTERGIHPTGKPNPTVGAVLRMPDGTVHCASRNEISKDHGEYTLLERKLHNKNLSGSIMYSTLEPCWKTARSHSSVCCADLVENRGITDLWVGIKDPDPTVHGQAMEFLEKQGVKIHRFDPDLEPVIRLADKTFIADAEKRAADEPKVVALAKHPKLGAGRSKELALSDNNAVRTGLAENPATPPDVLKQLVDGDLSMVDTAVRKRVAANLNTRTAELRKLAGDKDKFVREEVAKNRNTSSDLLEQLAADDNSWVRQSVAENPRTKPEVLKLLASDVDVYVREAAKRRLALLENQGAAGAESLID